MTTATAKIRDLVTSHIDKSGYRVVNVESDVANEMPMEIFAENAEVYAYAVLIPYCHRTATVVYFVSGRGGDEFGQFPSQEEAQVQFDEIS